MPQRKETLLMSDCLKPFPTEAHVTTRIDNAFDGSFQANATLVQYNLVFRYGSFDLLGYVTTWRVGRVRSGADVWLIQ